MRDPDSASLVFDHPCLGRNWKTRRVVYSERVLALAHVGAEKMLDVIPLSEIINIQDCDGVGSADADEDAGRVMLEITLTVGFWHETPRGSVALIVICNRIGTQMDCYSECSMRHCSDSETTTPRTRRKAFSKYSEPLTPT